jgi:hypothetical protein
VERGVVHVAKLCLDILDIPDSLYEWLREVSMVDVAIPPEVAERLNIVNCIKDIITIPPREYLFAVADEGDLVQVRNEEGGWEKTVDLVHYGIV